MSRDGHDVHCGVGRFSRKQVELLALIIDQTDIHLDAGFALELFLEGSRDEIIIGPDVHFIARGIGAAQIGRGGQCGAGQGSSAQEATAVEN